MSTTTLLQRFTSTTGLSRRRKRRQRHPSARPRGLRLEPLERRDLLSADVAPWLIGLHGDQNVIPNDTAVCPAGNVFVVGRFHTTASGGGSSTVDLDPSYDSSLVLNNADGIDSFLAKYDAEGHLAWAYHLTGESTNAAWRVETDGFSVFVTGAFGVELVLRDMRSEPVEDTTLSARGGGGNAFLAKWDMDGNLDWAVGFGHEESSSESFYANLGSDVAIAADGSALVVGHFHKRIDFGNDIELSWQDTQETYEEDAFPDSLPFLVRVDVNGSATAAVTWQPGDFDPIEDTDRTFWFDHRIALDSVTQDIYVSGIWPGLDQYYDPPRHVWGPFLARFSLENDTFLLKELAGRELLGGYGDPRGYPYGQVPRVRPRAIAVSPAGTLWMAILAYPDTQFGDKEFSNYNVYDYSVLVHVDTTAEMVVEDAWQIETLDPVHYGSFAWVHDLSVGNDDELIVVGSFNGTIDVDPTEAEWLLTGSDGGFIAKYGITDGLSLEGAWRWGPTNGYAGRRISVEIWQGNIIVAGCFYDVAEFPPDGRTLHSAGYLDGFVLRFDPSADILNWPVAFDDTYQVLMDAILNVAAPGVLTNDLAPEGRTLSADLVTEPTHGELYFNPDGSFTYTPPPNYLGADSFQYRAYDGELYSNVATVTIDVEGLTFHSTDTPKAIADALPNRARKTESVLTVSGTNAEVGALVLDVSISASRRSDLSGYLVSPEGTSVELFYRVHTIPTSYNLSGQFFGQPLDGNWTLEIWDHERGGTATLEAWSLTVAPLVQENLAPIAVDDSYTVSWNQTLNIAAPGVLANDSDPNGDPLTAVLESDMTEGELTLNADGSFTYVPQTDFVGTDSFTYRAFDGELYSAPATVTINVVNHAPAAVDDAYTTDMDVAITVTAPGVLGNDSDADGDELTAVLVEGSGPTNGSVVLNENGSFTYTPDGEFVGTDSFNYLAYDGNSYSNEATVTITVIDPNAPVEPSEPLEYTSADTPMTIEQAHPRQGARDTISTITIAGSEVTEIGSYGQFAIVLDITHPRPADLSAQLVSPAGTSVDVFGQGQFPIDLPWETNAFDTETLDGTWTLVLQDHGRGGSGTLNSWSITVTPANAEGDATGDMMVFSAEPSGAPSGDLITASSGDATVQPESEAVQVDQGDASAAWQRPPVQASAVDPLMAVLGRPAPSVRPGDASSPLDDRIGDLLDTLLDDLLPAGIPAR